MTKSRWKTERAMLVFLVVLDITVPADQSVTIIFSVLGGLYGAVAASAFIFIVLPRLLAGRAARQAIRPALRLPRVRAARPRPTGLRWSPAYSRPQPGSYVPRQNVQLQRAAPRSVLPERRFTVPDIVCIQLYNFQVFIRA